MSLYARNKVTQTARHMYVWFITLVDFVTYLSDLHILLVVFKTRITELRTKTRSIITNKCLLHLPK